MEGNFGGGKRWRIWRMTVDSPNFIQLKKVSRDEIYFRYYCRPSILLFIHGEKFHVFADYLATAKVFGEFL